MSGLEPTRSAPTAQPRRPPAGRARSSTAAYPRLTNVYSAQHLDDVSDYHGGDHDSQYRDHGGETSDLDNLEKARQDDYDDAEKYGDEDDSEVRDGVPNTKDLESKLEKKPTTRSIKDPNLVNIHLLLE